MKKLFTIFIFTVITSIYLSGQSKNWTVLQKALPSGLPAGLQVDYIASSFNKNIIWASFDSLYTALSIDGGKTWSSGRIEKVPGKLLLQLVGVNATTAMALTIREDQMSPSELWKTTDSGKTWKKDTSVYNAPTSFLDGILFFNELEGVLVGDPVNGKHELLRTKDGAKTWTKVESEALFAVTSLDAMVLTGRNATALDNVGIHAMDGGNILVTKNKGVSFEKIKAADATDFILTVLISGPNHYYVRSLNPGTNKTTDLVTADGGKTWTKITVTDFASYSVNSIPGSNGGYFMTGANGTFTKYKEAYTLDNFKTIKVNDDSVDIKQPINFLTSYNFDINNGWAFNRSDKDNSYIFASKWNGTVLSDADELTTQPLNTIVYPNPLIGNTLSFKGEQPENISLYDLQGRLISEYKNIDNAVNLPTYLKGLYNIVIEKNKMKSSQKIVIID